MNQININNKNQRGRSMIEILAVLMIVGVITVGAVAGLNQVNEKYKVSKTHQDIQSINSSIVDLYSWQRSYPEKAPMITLCANDVFPDGCEEDNSALNPFGGIYTVTMNKTAQTITITATMLTEDSCLDLTENDWPFEASVPTCTKVGDNYTFSIELN